MKAKALLVALSLALLAGCGDDEARIDGTTNETFSESIFFNMEQRHKLKLEKAFEVFAEPYPEISDLRVVLHGKTLDEMIEYAEELNGAPL